MHQLEPSIWAPEFVSCAQRSVRKVISQMKQIAPHLAQPFLQWLAIRCDLEEPEEYFLLPNALTLLSLPWWLEQSLCGKVDIAFQARLMEASTNLYYFARTLDDMMDGHPTEKAALPALYPFLLDFQGKLFEDFPASDAFWTQFRRYMDETAEVTSVDASLLEIDEDAFVNIAARKTSAVLVPVAAVCHRHDRQDALAAWEDYFHVFACWHQFRNDLMGWSDDDERGARTWLLCEAGRRRRPEESVAMWMGREGFSWAGQRLAQWMTEMKQKAFALNSPELLRYLDLREQLCAAQVGFLTQSAAAWARLLESASASG